jgi:5'-3' exonuclease
MQRTKHIVVVDASTLIHAFGYRFQDFFFDMWNLGLSFQENLSEKSSSEFISLTKAAIYQELCRVPNIHKAYVIFAHDRKARYGYWRNLIYPEYKGNRKKQKEYPSTRYRTHIPVLREIFAYAATSLGSNLSAEGYEADDIWGYVWRNKPEGCKLTGITIDFDWAQLVDEDTLIWDFKYEPNLRDLPTVLELIANHRDYKTAIEHPSEIVELKQRKGDRGDNLPAGSPIELFDLRTLPEEYGFDDKTMDWGGDIAIEPFIRDEARLAKAERWIQTLRDRQDTPILELPATIKLKKIS